MRKRILTAFTVFTGILFISASIVWADPPAPVAKTGQTISYRTGDDGYYEKGVASPSPRFTENGDGTITDNLTGLMWAKDANLTGSMNWSDAIDYANNLSLGSYECGASYIDWRLPNVKELQSLIDFGNLGPALPTGHFFSNVLSSDYWTSTTHAYDADASAWFVNMSYSFNNEVAGADKTWVLNVWPVRGGSIESPSPVAQTGQTTSYANGDDGDFQKGVASSDPRFTDNEDGTVTDNLTGLMWAKDANLTSSMNWSDAIDYANNLSLGSYECGASYIDWRLPNVKELQSLIDFSNTFPALTTGHPFSNVISSFYWTSTTSAYDTGSAVAVLLVFGNVSSDGDKTSNLLRVWPVRGGN